MTIQYSVGYGDFSPVNEIEQVFGMVYMLLNIILQAWVIGSITLLIVKQDEATGKYRETLERLSTYSKAHNLSRSFYKRLKTQVKLDFENAEMADEQVLNEFPISIRRKILRKLYLKSALQTRLLQGCRQQFVDAFLTTATVEIFSPGEELLTKGNMSSDLYLLVGGVIKLVTRESTKLVKDYGKGNGSQGTSSEWDSVGGGSSLGASGSHNQLVRSGEFVNAVGFFTESPQMATARTMTVCKTLTLPKSAYKILSQEDFPEDAQKVLENLLNQVREMKKVSAPMLADPDTAASLGRSKRQYKAEMTSSPSNLSEYDDDDTLMSKSVRFEGHDSNGVDDGENEGALTQQAFQLQAAQATLVDLVQSHAAKLRDDRTTRFLFAASRGDIATMSILLQKGLDTDAADYDKRTALMVAAMNGHAFTCRKLLELHADPNLVDMHGASALSEAAMNGQDECAAVLIKYGAKLCLTEAQAASTMCQAVFDGDTKRLERLIEAKVNVNAGDYDKRTALHIAAAEGNLAALKVLVEKGRADLSVTDRWNCTPMDEAKKGKAGHVLEYLEKLEETQKE